MSGDVIGFQAARMARHKAEAANDEWTDLGPSVDLAVWLHDIVVDGVRCGQFSGHEHGPSAALAELLSHFHIRGSCFVEVAEEHFRRVYGCDPYTFIARLTN